MITITGLDDFPTALSGAPLADGWTALGVVHMPTPGTSEIAYTAAYLVDSAGRATKLGQSEPYGKDIAVSVVIRGLVFELWVTEPPPYGSGAASQMHRYDFPIGLGTPAGTGTVDSVARAQLANHETRLDRIAAGAAG